MLAKARYATLHRLHYAEILSPESVDRSTAPATALSWKVGFCGPVGANGMRVPGRVWCLLGLFADEAAARAVWQAPQNHLPFAAPPLESWHGLLLPTMHRGECNHLQWDEPGLIFEPAAADPGGTCVVLTTAGFVLGPGFDVNRAISFRRKVDQVNDWLAKAPGVLATQVFTALPVGTDGCTVSLWRDDASMLAAAYQPGQHRENLDAHKQAAMCDRTSFTRLRLLASSGTWDGRDPVAGAL